jgi:TolB-like protein/Tfp pilus assembly protein PilF
VEPGKSVPSLPDSLRVAEIRAQSTSGANRRSRLLRYLVEQTLEDRADSLKESVIATEVFDRAPGYDPQIDSVVRVEIGRLRARLAEYYEKTGVDAPVRIEIPRGAYRPVFIFRDSAPEAVAIPGLEPPPVHGWKWIGAGIAVALLAAVLVWRLRTTGPPTPMAIAVLPFLNLSGDPSDEYLADGVTEELTETLAEFNELRVVARTSAFQYKGKNVDVSEIGRNLRAGAVLEGSVARRGGQLRVIAQLIRTNDGYHLWSHSYDTTLGELQAVEAGIALISREKLAPSGGKAVLTDVTVARNPEAHDLYMRAVYEFNLRTEASTRQAMDLARQATEKDPAFAQPWVVMAAGESQLTQLQAGAPREGAERAWQYSAKALAIEPGNSGAHAQKALLAYTDHWDWPQAEKEFKLALAAGSHGSAENLYGWCLITRGRFEEARRRLQLAAELDPLSLGPQLNQVEELMAEQNYPEAKRRVDQILRTAPSNSVALSLATSIAFWQKDCPGARGASGKLTELYPKAPGVRLIGLAADYVCGHPDEARVAALELFRHPSGYLSPYSIAGGLALSGNADPVMPYLEKSAELREPRLMMLRYDRVFESIRQDARFIALERRLGLLE